ncbi:GNAT family N-acetyltransferase [Microlunatus flavus]|uniref:Acetyltransferase (GNAT) family protein n=1 Tax=Microlunatus flavus TaxID=1036181 RepID=A0A1H9N1W0_9ACTN|nr:GNAT family N-acetyltransferase [Microlunatus flavus]SER29980.1 Acetyltransferase (GNAT) family protein [Microlunatus flavus]
MISVTAAINDAPMGDLTFEDEVYDLARLRAIERAVELRGERFRRVVTRHRRTGELAGHTALTVRPWAPREAYQYDTSVARDHRGHRLGLALKIAMMRWLAETEPQLEVVETWNNVENTPMIRVNEALGYRLSRTFAMFEKTLAETV